MASSVAEGPPSSSCAVGSVSKKIASPPPVDDDEDDDEFSRLLNAHKKARDDGGGASRIDKTPPVTAESGSQKPSVKRQKVVDYGDLDGAGARRYSSANPRRRGGRVPPATPGEHTTMGLVPPRPLRFPFPPYCGPLAKLVSSGPPPPLPADEKSLMVKELMDRVQFLTAENERLTWIVLVLLCPLKRYWSGNRYRTNSVSSGRVVRRYRRHSVHRLPSHSLQRPIEK
ncbi:hypothetical protein FOZ60_011652 [Perkinsus olseni]|uniref:Uncharacterized protein n=1 Tax=Perkinsus olseni TaxID=32597 RepID=A0A7J6PAX4_PEROL|nr:hypothetical protein FOZ60_011652 [Perkinsus olseni]